jgi:hypothetical protein
LVIHIAAVHFAEIPLLAVTVNPAAEAIERNPVELNMRTAASKGFILLPFCDTTLYDSHSLKLRSVL